MFDPSSPRAAHWRRWLNVELGNRGVPSNATLELHIRAVGEAPVTRLVLDLCWEAQHDQRHAHAEALIPVRRVIGEGWTGWTAYLAGLRLLRAPD